MFYSLFFLFYQVSTYKDIIIKFRSLGLLTDVDLNFKSENNENIKFLKLCVARAYIYYSNNNPSDKNKNGNGNGSDSYRQNNDTGNNNTGNRQNGNNYSGSSSSSSSGSGPGSGSRSRSGSSSSQYEDRTDKIEYCGSDEDEEDDEDIQREKLILKNTHLNSLNLIDNITKTTNGNNLNTDLINTDLSENPYKIIYLKDLPLGPLSKIEFRHNEILTNYLKKEVS